MKNVIRKITVLWYKVWHWLNSEQLQNKNIISGTSTDVFPCYREMHQGTVCNATLSACSLVVNAPCVVYGDVGHLFVVLLGIRPQVKVDNCSVDVARLSVSLLHQLAEACFDQFYWTNGTAADLHLSSVPRRQQLTWERREGGPHKIWLVSRAARFSLKCESRFFSLRIEINDSITILHTVCCQ